MKKSLTELEAEIREFVDRSEFLRNTLNQRQQLSLLWSSLDIVNDTEVGIGEYAVLSELSQNSGSYLLISGVLQLLQVQQDAVKYLCEAVNIQYPKNEEALLTIRDVRNGAIGHPVRSRIRDGENKKTTDVSNLIVRATMRAKEFTLYHYGSEDIVRRKTEVNLPDLIQRQQIILAEVMNEAFKELKRQENEYRQKHRNVKFKQIFSGCDYVAQKLLEAATSDDQHMNGSSLTEMLSNVIDKFEDEIRHRGLAGHLLDEVPPMRRALHQLKKHFDGNSSLPSYDARIYADYLKRQFGRLVRIGHEVDSRFEVDE